MAGRKDFDRRELRPYARQSPSRATEFCACRRIGRRYLRDELRLLPTVAFFVLRKADHGGALTVLMPTDDEPRADEIAARTLGHYQANASAFWARTRDHDVSQNYSALLAALGNRAALRLLDFGCGPGRDLVALSALGHDVTGLEGAPAFVGMARANSGCTVLEQSFFELDLEERRFDGVFANASLFHVPRAILPRVLGQLFRTLEPGGVLFCSNPRSFDRDWEGWQGERYGSYLTIGGWSELISAAGFVIERHFLRPPLKPPAEQPWLAIVARKPE
jgi:SAM-dependent methyltransferase